MGRLGWADQQDNLCKALGIPGKNGIDGSMVYDFVMEGWRVR